MKNMYTKRLIDLREEHNLKQYKLAKIIKLAPTTFNNYETEYETMPIKHLNKITNYFDVSFDYLFEFTNLPKYKGSRNEIDTNLAGQRLKEFRKSKNLTQNDLATYLNIDQTTVSKYEIGKEIISTNFLYEICKKYHISADYLLGKVDK